MLQVSPMAKADVKQAKLIASILRNEQFPPPRTLPPEPKHGTYDMHARYGCGCRKCLAYARRNQRPKGKGAR